MSLQLYKQKYNESFTAGLLAGKTMGLLTTIDELQPEFQKQYPISYKIVEKERPLDLSVKNSTILIETNNSTLPIIQSLSSPLKKRYRNIPVIKSEEENVEIKPCHQDVENINKINVKINTELTPTKKQQQIKSPTISSIKQSSKASKLKTNRSTKDSPKKSSKAVRKLKFDENKSSPVSGTIIRALEEIDENVVEESGDIDPQYNIVEVTDEAKAELSIIENIIGAYNCKLCRLEFEDAFLLARHRCSCIVLLEYRCPECGKRFNCPANLASHRRWHKPKDGVNSGGNNNNSSVTNNNNKQSTDLVAETATTTTTTTITSEKSELEPIKQYACDECSKTFKRQAYLRKHQSTHRRVGGGGGGNTAVTATTISNDSITKTTAILTIQKSDSSLDSNQFNYRETTDDDFDDDNSNSNSINSPPLKKYRLFTDNHFTEEENMAAATLAHLRNGASTVIKHTTALAV